MVNILNLQSSRAWARQSTNTIPNDGNGIRQQCRSSRPTSMPLAARLGFDSVSTFASGGSAHEFMDTTQYGSRISISARLAVTWLPLAIVRGRLSLAPTTAIMLKVPSSSTSQTTEQSMQQSIDRSIRLRSNRCKATKDARS
jgi:hypothetical protein